MNSKAKTILQNLSVFSHGHFSSDLKRQILQTVFPYVLASVSAFIMHMAPLGSRSRDLSKIWIPLLFLCITIFMITDWLRFYRGIVLPALRFERIRLKYSLINADQMTDFRSSLDIILDLIDSSMQKEYSQSLLQKQAQLDAMQSQINPHFLYNTLDTIRGYAVMEEAPITSDMVEILSRLFRYMISQKIRMVTLRQEIGILYDYIKIMEYRTNRNIVVLEKIEPNLPLMNYQIPKLIIQPIVENAIKHGFDGVTKEFIITLSIYCTESCLIVSIADNGKGMPPEQLRLLNEKLSDSDSSISSVPAEKKQGSGIALTNVNSRIKLMYGDAYGVVAYSTLGEGSEFQLRLPWKQTEG